MNKGFKHTEETRKKMSEAQTGKVKSPETRARMAKAHEGIFHSPETIAKMRASHKKRVATPEVRESRRRGAHKQWHTRRNIIKPGCRFCEEDTK